MPAVAHAQAADWQKTWDQVLAAARKEGKVVVAGPPDTEVRQTLPAAFGAAGVPAVLLSGHHAAIERWRRDRSLELTARQRPELIAAARAAGRLSRADEGFLATLGL